MALGIGKKGCERLGVTNKMVEMVSDYSEDLDYYEWQEYRSMFQEDFPQTDKWLSQCVNFPSRLADIVMEMFNEILDGFGVEAIRSVGEHVDNYYFDIVATYVNTGDTYNTTVVYDTIKDRYIVTTWGDFVESRGY